MEDMTSAESRPPEPAVPEHDDASPPQATAPWSEPVRVAFLFTGVVLPFLCFVIGFPDAPEWQSGHINGYAQLLLTHKPSIPLYPFLLYNMTSMALVVVAPHRFRNNSLVRFGIYTGGPLAVGYWVVFQIALGLVHDDAPWAVVSGLLRGGFLSGLAVLIPGGLVLLLDYLTRKFDRSDAWMLVLALLLSAAVCLFPFALYLCLLCATPWAIASYTAMSVSLFREGGAERLRFTLAQLLGVVAWAAAWLGAWRASFLWMLHEYSRLPASPPPDCYVSTAAARGHPRLVGSRWHVSRHGEMHVVNGQMCTLKAAELLLASLSPRAHRACRWAYDRIGPRLASALVHPLLADAAYLFLKPPEWLARAALALLVPAHQDLIRRLYD